MSERRPSLLPLLRSDNQLRILAALLLEPERSYTITELSRATGVPQASVSREVAQLTATSILRTEIVRGRREIQADTTSPIFPELASLLLKTVGPKAVLEAALDDLAGVTAGYIYGSWARRYHGEPGAQPADIDLLVVGAVDVVRARALADAATGRLGRDVNLSVLTPAEWEHPETGFARALRDAPSSSSI